MVVEVDFDIAGDRNGERHVPTMQAGASNASCNEDSKNGMHGNRSHALGTTEQPTLRHSREWFAPLTKCAPHRELEQCDRQNRTGHLRGTSWEHPSWRHRRVLWWPIRLPGAREEEGATAGQGERRLGSSHRSRNPTKQLVTELTDLLSERGDLLLVCLAHIHQLMDQFPQRCDLRGWRPWWR